MWLPLLVLGHLRGIPGIVKIVAILISRPGRWIHALPRCQSKHGGVAGWGASGLDEHAAVVRGSGVASAAAAGFVDARTLDIVDRSSVMALTLI